MRTLSVEQGYAKKLACLTLFRTVIKLFFLAHSLFDLASPLYDSGAFRYPMRFVVHYAALLAAGVILLSICLQKASPKWSSICTFVGMVGYAAVVSWIGIHFPHTSLVAMYISFAMLAVSKAAVSYYLDYRK